MLVQLGPPLPRSMQIYWPWIKPPAPPEIPEIPLPPPPGVPLLAKYRLYVYTVGKGTVTPVDGEYPAGSVITLTARPGYGAAFDRWAGDAAGTSPIVSVAMDRSKSATAYFKAITPLLYDEAPPPEEMPPVLPEEVAPPPPEEIPAPPPAAPPPAAPPPPSAVARFYMPSRLTIREAGPYNGFYTVTFSTRITNTGNASGSYRLIWGSNYITASPYLPGYGPWEEEAARIITLAPGESHDWSWTYEEVFDFYRGYFTCQLFGVWEGDNKAVGVWR